MNKTKYLSYYFRKSPFIRTLFWIAIILIVSLVFLLSSIKSKPEPKIYSIMPPVGSPGDLIIITGKDFGIAKEDGYVEFGGIKLTSSAFISWSDTEIKIILPSNIKDGLVFVGTKDVRSKPVFFANSTTAPIAIPQNTQTTLPLITSISPEKITPGTLITISGVNFGSSREHSQVFFSADRELKKETSNNSEQAEDFSFIEANNDDFDYVSWSDSEIKLYVPDGATSGYIYVSTAKGNSSQRKIEIERKAGKKSFIAPKTYLIQLAVDIDDTNGDKESTIVLRCPRPYITPAQPSVKLTECTPEPIIEDFQHTLIQQTSGAKQGNQTVKAKFKQNFAVTVYETRTEIVVAKTSSDVPVNKTLYAYATKQDQCVPSGNEDIIALAKSIVKNETNTYNKAALIYNYMLKNYSIRNDSKKQNKSPLDLLKTKRGDAYDFAIIYTALLRACKIPALPDSGILVGTDMKTQNHWWSEFYLSGFGWIPVDPALGAGLKFQVWQKDFEPSQFYFGNIDGQHIIFSRGWNEIKPSAPNNKTVPRPKSYALQSIWEEASGKNIKYSSYWANPTVIGIY